MLWGNEPQTTGTIPCQMYQRAKSQAMRQLSREAEWLQPLWARLSWLECIQVPHCMLQGAAILWASQLLCPFLLPWIGCSFSSITLTLVLGSSSNAHSTRSSTHHHTTGQLKALYWIERMKVEKHLNWGNLSFNQILDIKILPFTF